MDQDLKRISSELRLPPDSRERIRAQLASCQNQKEEIPMKKAILKTRVLLIAAVVLAMTLTFAAAAIVAPQFLGPLPPAPLEEAAETFRYMANNWLSKESINGDLAFEYNKWDDFELVDNDPAFRSRRITRADGAVKMQYTAKNPADLADTLTEVALDLSWLGEHYDHVPDANFSYVVTDPMGDYAGEVFQALYAKPDGSGRVDMEIQHTSNIPIFTLLNTDRLESNHYYTTDNGYEFQITMNNGHTWVEYDTAYTMFYLHGAYLTLDEIEEILDNLHFSIKG